MVVSSRERWAAGRQDLHAQTRGAAHVGAQRSAPIPHPSWQIQLLWGWIAILETHVVTLVEMRGVTEGQDTSSARTGPRLHCADLPHHADLPFSACIAALSRAKMWGLVF